MFMWMLDPKVIIIIVLKRKREKGCEGCMFYIVSAKYKHNKENE